MLLRWVTLATFVTATAVYVGYSVHWRLAIDSPIMHYVVFLMHRGLRPYIDITDNNMPGAYLTEAAAMRVFGGGDLGWRLYEFFLLGTMAAAMVWISRRTDWLAGVFAAGAFIALHASEGPPFAGEREMVVTTLVFVSLVPLFLAVQKRNALWMLGFGLSCGLAIAIKPTFILFAAAVLTLALVVLHQRSAPLLASLLLAILGMALVGALCLLFLLRYHALSDFVFILTRVLPRYANLAPQPWGVLLRGALPRSLFALLLLTLPLAYVNWRHFGAWNWERWALLLGAFMGLVSYLVQRKGFLHHRYTLIAFLLLLIGLELFTALRQTGWPFLWAAGCLLYMLFGFTPRQIREGSLRPDGTRFYAALNGDLDALGGPPKLQHRVFCFDLVYGCLNVLYHRGIVEDSGFTGDLLLFPHQPNAATDFYRQRFWKLAATSPPAVLIVSNEDLMTVNSFKRLSRWPELDTWLRNHYTLAVERNFAQEQFGIRHPGVTLPLPTRDAYRIYLRKGSPFLAAMPKLAAVDPNR